MAPEVVAIAVGAALLGVAGGIVLALIDMWWGWLKARKRNEDPS